MNTLLLWLKSSTTMESLTPKRTRLNLELCEARETPAVFTVTNFTDDFDATGTFRAAINQANANPGADTITFATGTRQVRTIKINQNGLPKITDSVSIDGSLQLAFIAGRFIPGIELDGSNINFNGDTGLEVRASQCVIKGLIINRCNDRGLRLVGNNNTVKNCYLGTNSDGSADGGSQFVGLSIFGSNNIIGGTALGDRNVISGNALGIAVSNGTAAGATGNIIIGNRIGTNARGNAAIPNNLGITLEANARNSVVQDNLVSGNTVNGIRLASPGTSNNTVFRNTIGLALDKITPLGNGKHGIFIDAGAHDNGIGSSNAADGNIIGFNGQRGILIGIDTTQFNQGQAGAGNRVLGNQIFGSPLGIDLGPLDGNTPNDALDADTGPNNLQNSPFLTGAASTNGQPFVTGTVTGVPNRTMFLEIYTCAANKFDLVNNRPTEMKFLTSAQRVLDANGSAAVNLQLSALADGTFIFFTATDELTGDTSEYSNAAFANNIAPTIQNDILTPVIDEGSFATLSGNVVDANAEDTLRLLVNWGDGTDWKTYNTGRDAFSLHHKYKDDDVYNVTYIWADDTNASNRRTKSIIVNNVAPTLSGIDWKMNDNGVVKLRATVVEPGRDHVRLIINWGDGQTDTSCGLEDGDKVQEKHRFQSPGVYDIIVTLTDDDGGSTVFTKQVVIA